MPSKMKRKKVQAFNSSKKIKLVKKKKIKLIKRGKGIRSKIKSLKK
jgi:hypothetical protein